MSPAAGTPVRVLLIEDNPGDAGLVRSMFCAADVPFMLDQADSLTAGIEHLRQRPTDVVLLDLGLPESTGLDTVRRLFAQGIEVPALVVLSGVADEDMALRALHAGAQDYLVKGEVDGPAIARSVRFAMSRIQAKAAPQPAEAKTEPVDAAPVADGAGRYAIYVNLSCELESRTQVRESLDQLAATLPEAFRVKSWSVWAPADDLRIEDVQPDASPAVLHEPSIDKPRRSARGLRSYPAGPRQKLH
jgi:DNA-binding response OmpR family regulator